MAACRGLALLLVVCSLCFAANIKDPLSRSGVWEASAIVDQRPIELLLSLQIETAGKTADGTFAVNEAIRACGPHGKLRYFNNLSDMLA